ncbi:hypothetical protein RchiOBHm_Chr1g0314271 [Rosa chinensis]|uniref:Uncharacterized protein n=1 Tax=Rosa chinensis TaxID=74649 RepID=A0A2P6S737_ROSCH|nr:hypothetical protein RchiOBHm_Chr1g0314271 [Rosa chinensis]
MAKLSALLNCFFPSSSSQVSDDAGNTSYIAKAPSSNESRKSKSMKSTSSSGAPIIVSHFPHNSYISRL